MSIMSGNTNSQTQAPKFKMLDTSASFSNAYYNAQQNNPPSGIPGNTMTVGVYAANAADLSYKISNGGCDAHAGWVIVRKGTGGRSGRKQYETLVAMTSMGNTSGVSAVSAPTNGALSATAGGSMANTTYYVKSTWVTATGETLPSTETNLAVTANNVLNVAAPASPPASAIGWNVYVSTTTGTETRQNGSIPIANTAAWVEPTSGLVAGAALPTANTVAAFRTV